jgi:hypothetical protein
MSAPIHSDTKTATFRLSKRLFFAPLLYPLIRVQTYMQSHFKFPVGEKLPTFKESLQLVRNEGGLYKGFSFHFAYNAGVLACWGINPILGFVSIGLLYPLELAQVYMASHGTSHINALERLKTNLFNTSNYRGVAMNFLSFVDPSGFFFNNIKRNLILAAEEGKPTTYTEVFRGLSASGMLLRGAVPGLILFLFR